jgi:hypothetical protein
MGFGSGLKQSLDAKKKLAAAPVLAPGPTPPDPTLAASNAAINANVAATRARRRGAAANTPVVGTPGARTPGVRTPARTTIGGSY